MMSDFKIDKNVPLPESKTKRGRKSIYPFREMKVNDSFLYSKEGTQKNQKGAYTAAYSWAKSSRNCTKRKFVARVTAKGIRVWRIK